MTIINYQARAVDRCISVPLPARKFGDANVLAILAVSSFRSSRDLSITQGEGLANRHQRRALMEPFSKLSLREMFMV
jgi:hypothetical protein